MRLAAAGLVAMGCGATPSYMQHSASTVASDPVHAIVVFVHHAEPRDADCAPHDPCRLVEPGRVYTGSPTVRVVDENAQFLGDSVAGTSFAATVTAGHHVFVGWDAPYDPGMAIAADVDAGRVYYVDILGSRSRNSGCGGRSRCGSESYWWFRPIHREDLVDRARITDGTAWMAPVDDATAMVGGDLAAVHRVSVAHREPDAIAIEDGYADLQ